MSSEAVRQVLERANTDEEFRSRCATNPDGPLAGYDLTDDERNALISGDDEALQAVGLDVRDSKRFTGFS